MATVINLLAMATVITTVVEDNLVVVVVFVFLVLILVAFLLRLKIKEIIIDIRMRLSNGSRNEGMPKEGTSKTTAKQEGTEARSSPSVVAPTKPHSEGRPQGPEGGRMSEKCLVGESAWKMVEIPRGTFRMGDLSGRGEVSERPMHVVTVSPFRMGKHEVTFSQWDACVADGGCGGYCPDDNGWGRGNRPVIWVSWDDVQEFIVWLNARTGGGYRLPTESEWEYAARAGSESKYSWGDEIGVNRANCRGCGSVWDGKRTAPVGSFPANAWGLHDMHGNVWEWVEDCRNDGYGGAPDDGNAWLSGDGECDQRVIRGGSWFDKPGDLRSSARYWNSHSVRCGNMGFRLARDR